MGFLTMSVEHSHDVWQSKRAPITVIEDAGVTTQ